MSPGGGHGAPLYAAPLVIFSFIVMLGQSFGGRLGIFTLKALILAKHSRVLAWDLRRGGRQNCHTLPYIRPVCGNAAFGRGGECGT